MIKDQWYVILSSHEVTKKARGIRRFGIELVVWRDSQGKVQCLRDGCIHRGASLCKGAVKEDHIVCPFHGFEFDGRGSCRLIPANGKEHKIPSNAKAQSYFLQERDGYVWLYYSETAPRETSLDYFDELESFSYSQQIIPWKAHYSRAIENQLDVVHIPFLHKSTIGRGNKTIVNGPLVDVTDTTLTIYTNNVADEGQAPLKPKELDHLRSQKLKLIFKFPNIWQNHINEKIRVTIAFVPVDEENTLMYLRFYQNITRIPLIKGLFNKIGSFANYIIQNQDRATVETQVPKISALKSNEFLIPGDHSIVEYRKIRSQLQKALPSNI